MHCSPVQGSLLPEQRRSTHEMGRVRSGIRDTTSSQVPHVSALSASTAVNAIHDFGSKPTAVMQGRR